MENIHAFPDRKMIEDEAATWLIKLDSDKPLTNQEQTAFREWLERSAVHRNAINQLNTFWGNNVLTELMVPLGKPETHRGLLANVFAGLMRSALTIGGLSVTAAVVTLALTLTLVLNGNNMTESNGLYVTAVGQQKSITMADGSTLQLNTNSQVEVEYNDNYRNIRLIQGEVHFDVAKNPALPFRVYAGSRRVQAVGTAFTVYLKDKEVNVLVTEGRVALAALETTATGFEKNRVDNGLADSDLVDSSLIDSSAMLAVDPYANIATKNLGELDAGQATTLTVTENFTAPPVQAVSREELKRLQSWRNGLLVFSGEPLQQVVNEISRYTTVSIEITDPEVRSMEIGGRFRVGDIDGMFSALEENFGLRVNRLAYNRVQLAPADE